MAKVLLINPPSPVWMKQKERNIPLGILYLSSSIKKHGHEVRFIDVNNEQISLHLNEGTLDLEEYYKRRISKVFSGFQPDLVGISVHYSGRFKAGIELAERLKMESADIPIVIGGIHPSIFPEEILNEYKCIDFILQGESEGTIVELVECLRGNEAGYADIDGLGYRVKNRVIINKKTQFIDDVDRIPFPDYDLVDIKEYYFDTSQWFNPKELPINLNIHILSSRSCPHHCSYCSMFLAHGPRYRMRSAINVLDEIKYLYDRFEQRYFSFMDDNFTLNRRRTLEICRGIIDKGLDIQFDTPNGLAINSLDHEIIEALVAAGMVKCCLAVESGSPAIRNKIGKKLPQEKIYSVIESIRGFPGLVFNTFFIVGFPDETVETLDETYELIRNLKLEKAIISFATPFPGTELFRECMEKGLLDISIGEALHNLDNFYYANDMPFIKPHYLEKRDLIEFRLKVYKELNMTRQLEYLEASSRAVSA